MEPGSAASQGGNSSGASETDWRIHRAAAAQHAHLTDRGNALRLVHLHGEDMRFSYDLGAWFHWNGERFAEDDTGEVECCAKRTAQTMLRDAATEADENNEEGDNA